MQTRSYDQYLTRVAGMIGLPVSGMTSNELGFLNAYFNNNITRAWQQCNWIDLCPYGEARFVGNGLHFTNDISKTSYWTPTNTTVTKNSLNNPLDGRQTACTLAETNTSGAHYINQPLSFVPGATYWAYTYARPIGGRYLYLSVNDGSTTFYSFFNLASGTVGTNANLLNTPTLIQQANGFWLCQFAFTASTSAGTGYWRAQTSSDGSTLSFTGDTSKGLYLWGNMLQQTTLTPASTFLIPWAQEGESVIDAVFQVFVNNPLNPPFPRNQGYQISPNGIQLINTLGWNGNYLGTFPDYNSTYPNPVYVYYRKLPNRYVGPDYSASAIYSIDDVVLFEDSDGTQNFWKCVVATSAGQSPESTPTSWEVVDIPDVLFQYACYSGYADWLRMDGQADKAQIQDAIAEDQLNVEFDKQERQMGYTLPMTVSTHVTSQSRY